MLFRPTGLHFQLIRRGRLRRSQARREHTERRAGDVRQPDLVAVHHRLRIAAVLAADSQLDVGPGLASPLYTHLHQLAHAFLVNGGKWIVLEHAFFDVGRQEGADIVARESVHGLSKVVGAEAEELRFYRDLIGDYAGARQLDHRPQQVIDAGSFLFEYLFGNLAD